MDSHLGRALWRFSVDALTSLLTYDEGTRLQQVGAGEKRRPKRRRSPRAPDAFGVLRRRNSLPLRERNSGGGDESKQRSSPPASPRKRRHLPTSSPTQAQHAAHRSPRTSHQTLPSIPTTAPPSSHADQHARRERARRPNMITRRVAALRDICSRRAVRFDPLPVVIEG